MKVRGDLDVCRTVTSKRTDEALVDETLTANRQIVRHEAHWMLLDGGVADREVELPDATTLPEGWQIVVQNDGSTNVINVREYNATSYTGAIQDTLSAGGIACEFTLLDNSTAAGTWYVNCLESPDNLVAVKYCATFTTGDFQAASGGYQILDSGDIAGLGASTHGRGTSPIYILQEDVGGGDFDRVLADRERMNSSGDLEIRVAEGCTFDGRVCFV
jgi:hypothetical protein